MFLALLATTAAFAAPPCTHGQLTFHIGRSDAGAGHVFFPLVFTNTGATCTLRGYPGVSSVAGDDGHQVGPPASRDPHPVRTVTLKPHHHATATLDHVNPGVVDPSLCRADDRTRLPRLRPGPDARVLRAAPAHGVPGSALPGPRPARHVGGQGISGLPISQWWPNGSSTRPSRQPCSSDTG